MKGHRIRLLCLLVFPLLALGAKADSARPEWDAERFEALVNATGATNLSEDLSFRVNCLAPSSGGARISYGANRGCGTPIDDILVIDTTVDINDIVNPGGNQGSSGVTAVSEPSAFFLLAVGLIGALHMRQVMLRRW